MYWQLKYMSDQRLSLFLCSGFVLLTPEFQAAIFSLPRSPRLFPPPSLRAQTTDTTEGSSSLYCPRTRSLTSFWFYGSNRCSEKLNRATLPFQAWNRRTRSAFVWLISQKMSAILLRLLVRPFVLLLALLFVQRRIVELMNVPCCYYLLACACMDLLFLCFVSLFWGGGTETLV